MEIEFSDEAKRNLKRLDRAISRRILTRLIWLRDNFDTVIHVKLTGQWSQFFKLRVGDYRVLYEIVDHESLIFVIRVQHRREVYR